MPAPMPPSIYHPPSHNLKQYQFLIVRRDAHRTPFQRPYEEPFKVMQAGDKTFTTDRGGQKEFISAFVDLQHPVVVSEPKNRRSPPNKGNPLVPTQPKNGPKSTTCAIPAHQIRRSSSFTTMLHLGSGESGVEDLQSDTQRTGWKLIGIRTRHQSLQLGFLVCHF